jgi:hypothetical protein
MNNITKSREKLAYLINMMLKENDFEVLGLDISVDTYTPKTTTKEEPQPMVELYDIFLSVDYLKEIPSWESSRYINTLSKVLNKIDECVTEFTITSEGKVVRGSGDMSMSSRISDFHFKEEELSKFEITYHFLNPNT